MNSEQVDALATRIMELINAQLRSPTKAELVKIIVDCGATAEYGNAQAAVGHTHTLTQSQVSDISGSMMPFYHRQPQPYSAACGHHQLCAVSDDGRHRWKQADAYRDLYRCTACKRAVTGKDIPLLT